MDKELGCKLPLATLFRAPTIAALVPLLGPTGATSGCRAVPIQPHGSRPPLFCIPGGGSDVIIFQDLARELGSEQPVYGLQARGLDATPVSGEFPSVEAVAADFVSALRQVQSSGPYFVAGHCFGSLLAWEVACQLKREGQAVALLALLDPIVSNVFSGEIMGRDRLRYHFEKFWKAPVREKCRYFAEKVRNFSRTLLVRQRIAHAYDMARSMHERYAMPQYPGSVVVFLADDSFLQLSPERDPRLYYERLALEGTRYVTARGDHHTMLHPPAVAGLAGDLRGFLDPPPIHPPARTEILR